MRTVVPLYISSILVYIRRVMLISMHSSYCGGVVNLVQSLYDLVVFFLLLICLSSDRHIPHLVTVIYVWSLRPDVAATTQPNSKISRWACMC
jgi:hypothetical protein